MRLTREDRPTGRVVIKEAVTPDDQRRLEREAHMLRCAAHPGIVQLIGQDAGSGGLLRLATREATGGELIAHGELEAPEILGLGAALATTLADLHDLGIAHGAVESRHVVIDEEGRPLLCSLGRASHNGTRPDRASAARRDVAALAELLTELLRGDGPRSVTAALRAAQDPRVRRPPSARSLARVLAGAGTGARLPAPSAHQRGVGSVPCGEPGGQGHRRTTPTTSLAPQVDDAPSGQAGPEQCDRVGKRLTPCRPSESSHSTGRPYSRRKALPFLAAALTLAAVPAVVTLRRSGGPNAAATTACPVADAGCAPVALSGGVLSTPTGRFQLGQPGDVVVLGRWRCGAVALPALLRPATGELWVFDRWAGAGVGVPGRAVGTIAGARSLRVLPLASGCDRLMVIRGQRQQPQRVSPGAPP